MNRLIATLAAAMAAASVQAQVPGPVAKPQPGTAAPVEMKATGIPGKAEGKRTAHASATITALDVAGRTLTLKGQSGETQTFRVGPEVSRLNEFAVGDVISVDYVQGLALEFQPADAETVSPTTSSAAMRAGKDEAPGGASSASVQATVTVTAIDPAARLVSFQGPGGKTYQVKAGPRIQLEKLKVGDRLLATYTEAVAVKVQKPRKK